MLDEDIMIERAINASAACLLVPLQHDFDAFPIAHDDFKEFRLMLDDQLHLLLDILYQNRSLLLDQTFDNQLVQLRVNLVILCCEQLESNPLFQTEQKILLASLSKIADENFGNFDDGVWQKIIQTYKEGLRKDCWKRQLGMIHGFPKFCEFLFKMKPGMVNNDVTLFILSIGSNLVTHYDPHYKTVGNKIYCHILKLADKVLLKDLNIHQVIYNECIQMVRKSSEFDFNDLLYDCLHLTMVLEKSEVSGSQWSKFDNIMSELITQFSMESEAVVASLLLKKIIKFCGLSYDGIEAVPLSDHLESHYNELKSKVSRGNIRSLRWTKKLMEMMVRESTRMMTNSSNCFTVSNAFHSIYILTISSLDASVLGQQLVDFSRKMILVLMQAASLFRNDSSIVQSIMFFLKTIQSHQQRNLELVNCIEKILQHEVFCKNLTLN